MNRLRVVVDTNIVVSALNFGGPPGRVLEAAGLGLFQLYISESILQELQRVLEAKFRWSREETQKARAVITVAGLLIKPTERLEIIEEDTSDNRILECAVTAQAHYIVSGDKHLLRLGQWEDIRVITAADFLKVVL